MEQDDKNTVINWIICALVCLFSGFLELFTLTFRGAFSLMQTGNLIYSVTNLVEGKYFVCLFHILIIVSYIVGLVLYKFIVFFTRKNKELCSLITYGLIILLLLVTIFLRPTLELVEGSYAIDKTNYLNMISASIFSITGALIFSNFSKFEDIDFTPTMMTANLSRLVSAISNKKGIKTIIFYASLIFSFLIGVLIFSLLNNFWIKNISNNDDLCKFVNYLIAIPLIGFVLTFLLEIFNFQEKSNKKRG